MRVPTDHTFLALQVPRARRKSVATFTGFAPILDRWIIGPENDGVRELFASLASPDILERSPILLYGNSGAGKTAIALTLASRWIEDHSDRTYTLIHASDFAKSFARAIDADDMPRFRTQHRECDCFLLDNIHELQGKPSAQEELVETLKHLEAKRALVILTSVMLPSFLNAWNRALSSRILAGYSLEIALPGDASRNEIIKELLQKFDVSVNAREFEKLRTQLAEGQSVNELKGYVLRLAHHQRAAESDDIDEDMAVLSSLTESHGTRQPSPQDIIRAIGKEMQVPLEMLKGPTRKASIVRARGLAMHLIRQWTDTSYAQVGELFGGRDHTTVMHGCKKTEEDLTIDPELSQIVERIRQKLLSR